MAGYERRKIQGWLPECLFDFFHGRRMPYFLKQYEAMQQLLKD